MKKVSIIGFVMTCTLLGVGPQTFGQQKFGQQNSEALPQQSQNSHRLSTTFPGDGSHSGVGQASAEASYNLSLALANRGTGVDAEEITPELRKHFGAPADRGVLITRVAENGVGAQLQFEVGDIAVAVEGWPITSVRQLQGRLGVWQPGRGLRVQVIRKKKERLLELAPVAVVGRPLAVSQPRQELRNELQAEIKRLESRLSVLRDRLKRLEEDP